MGGELLKHVVRVESAPIELMVVHDSTHSGRALLRAGSSVTVQTRSLTDEDHLCGNEVAFYQPLTSTTHAMPAVATTDRYSGEDLGISWTLHEKRSAFVGSFAK